MKKQILTIQNDTSIRILLALLLRKHYDVITKSDGLEGMMWLDNGHHPDLILTDIKMPHLDGRLFVRSVKKSGFFHDIPILVLASTDCTQESSQCLEEGATDVMAKPFDPSDLILKIEQLLNFNNP